MSIDRLAERAGARGERDVELGARTTYRVGGRAALLLTLATESDAREFGEDLAELGGAVVALGNGSNLLVADGHHDVVVVRVAGTFLDLSWRDEGEEVVVEAGAGLDLPVAARRLAGAGVGDFEWAVGVPGTFGGAVAMNAGGHGSDVAASLVEARVLSRGEIATWSREQLDLGYRHSALAPGDVVLSVTLRLVHRDADDANARLREIVRWRRAHQPGGANGGSVFRNPDGDHAARLLEAAGLKGTRVGSAEVSAKHANFIQADAGGRAEDVYRLLTLMRERVLETSGVALVSEHRFVGFGATP